MNTRHANAAGATAEFFLNAHDFGLGHIPAAEFGRHAAAVKVVVRSKLVKSIRENVCDFNFTLHFIKRTLSEIANLQKIIFIILFAQLTHDNTPESVCVL